jgi:cytosine deaminase
LRAARRAVVRRGKVIAETAERMSRLSLEGRPDLVDPASYAPPR